MILCSKQVFDKVYLDRDEPSEFIEYVSYGVRRELVTKVMDKLNDHKLYIVRLHSPGFIDDLSTQKCAYEQNLQYMEVVQCKDCGRAYPWCQKFRDEFRGDGFCPYGKPADVINIDIINKAKAACDREDTDCAVCFKESHCKALAKAERELK